MADLAGSNSMLPFGRISGGGGGSIEFTKVNRDTTKEIRKEKNTDTVIPAGWAYLSIYHAGIGVPIQINGQNLNAQGNWIGHEVLDWPANKQEFGPQVNIVCNGEPFAFHVAYPTSSAVDVTTL